MNRKGAIDIRRVVTPARQRWVASRKRTLRRHSVRVARSVWSGLLSRVIECRNFIVGAFLFDTGGAVLRRTLLTQCDAARPASEGGAKKRVDIPGTWESLCFPVLMKSGLGRSRNQTSLALCGVSTARAVETMGTGRVLVSKRKTSWPGSESGSLSLLIVAFENRKTFSGGSR
jgi:hypothetical protein